jgi:hypothetical protein
VQAVVTVIAAAEGIRSRHVVPLDVFRNAPERLADRGHEVVEARLAPHDEVEAGTAPERRHVDDAGDEVAQDRGLQVLDRVERGRRDFALVGLYVAHVEVRDRVAVRSAFDTDQAHVRGLHGGVIQRETLDIGHGVPPERVRMRGMSECRNSRHPDPFSSTAAARVAL